MKSKLRSSLVALLSLSFIALFAVGCGDDREDFVITNTSQTGNGNLIFRFQQQTVTQTIVPAGTVQLRFDLFSTNPGSEASLVATETRNFAEVVTLENVPSNVVFVAVTAIGADGLPTQVRTGSVDVIPGASTEVVLENTVAVTFDSLSVTPQVVNLVFNREEVLTQQMTFSGVFSGDTFGIPITTPPATFTFDGPNLGNFSSTGLFSSGFDIQHYGSNTTVTAGYTFLDTTRTETFDIRTFIFAVDNAGRSSLAPGESYTAGYDLEFTNSAGQAPEIELTYALENPVTGVELNTEDGSFTTTGSTPEGTFNVVVSGTDPNTGFVVTDTVQFTIDASAMSA